MVNGVLCIDKPEGITSHDAVQHVRRATGERRVGHAGTLDPFATGILVIATGKATRLLEYMHMVPKTYTATFTLGATSDTDDVAGIITETLKDTDTPPAKQDIAKALRAFQGTIAQIPPQYAAIKIQGKKMYELAREGKHIEAKPRTVTIHDIRLLSYTYPDVRVEITCSAGTYIRAIARDLGKSLQTGAYTKELRRTRIGSFDENKAIPLSKLTFENYQESLQPLDVLASHLPRIELTASQKQDFEQGKLISDISFTQEGPHAIFDQTSNALIGIGKQSPTGELQPDKVLSL